MKVTETGHRRDVAQTLVCARFTAGRQFRILAYRVNYEVVDGLGPFVIVVAVSTAMAEREPYRNRIEILQGTLDLLILQTLQWGSQHCHGIAQAIRNRSGELLLVETGSLYPALHRLERQGWLASKWKISKNNQRAKYYTLTAAGKKQLVSEQSKWHLLVTTMSGVLNPAE